MLCLAANPSIDKVAEVESIEMGAIHRLPSIVALPGGKGLNVARAAALLGAEVTAVVLAAGHAGRWVVEEMAAEGVTVRAAWAAGETRSCLSVHDRSTGRLTEFYEPGGPISTAEWHVFARCVREQLEAGLEVMTISGSLPPGAPVNGYQELCAAAAEAGIRVLLDSHGDHLVAALEARPYLVKINAEEAAALVEGDVEGGEDEDRSVIRAAARLQRSTVGGAVVTRGSAGSIVAIDNACWRVLPAPLDGAYPVGSGDAFLAGLAIGLERGEDLVAAARRGAAAATANAMQPGAGRLDALVVDQLLDRIGAERIAAEAFLH